MRVLHAIESMDPAFGGTVEAVSQLARALQKRGIDNEILTLDSPASRFHPWLTVHAVGPPHTFYRYCAGLRPWLHRHLNRYDAVLVHGLWRHHSLGVWRECLRQGVPHAVVVHSMLNPRLDRGKPWKRARKVVHWKLLENRVACDAVDTVFTSESELREARSAYFPFPSRHRVLPLGTIGAPPGDAIDVECLWRKHPQLQGRRILLFLGRLHPIKACDDLIGAFARLPLQAHPDLRLVMAGPDTVGWRATLEQLAIDRNVSDRVVWTGPLEGGEKWAALRAAELLVLPSHCEAFPFSALEALSASLPVLVTDQVNIHDLLQRSKCALVSGDSEPSVAAELHRWLSLPQEQRQQMKAASLRCFSENFHVDAAARRWHEFLAHDFGTGPQTSAIVSANPATGPSPTTDSGSASVSGSRPGR